MAQGLLGSLPPGLRGMLAAEQMGQQRNQQQIGMLGGALGIQGQVQEQEIRQQGLVESQLQRKRLQDFALSLPEPERQRFLIDPKSYIKNLGESQFSKVDPKDFTPDSITAFSRTKNYADLVPVRKMEVSPSGDTYNPYAIASGDKINMLSPHQKWQQNTQFPQQQAIDRTKLGIDVAQFGYNTGMNPPIYGNALGGAPQRPAPQPAAPALGVPPPRTAPQAAPQQIVPTGAMMGGAAPNLPPKLQNEITAAGMKNAAELAGKREHNMTGINDTLTSAEGILKSGPTGSLIGKGQDLAASVVGVSLPGAQKAAQLKALAGALVLKMPRMEGPQSDKDSQLYREMAGQVGDDTVPVATRLAALGEVRRLYAKYEKGQNAQPESMVDQIPGASPQDRRAQPRRVVDY